ncbi:MAG: response regulator transcription factor [Ignavibacteria bacterium]|jgi:DNA-binding NarL/FixJ family response regulator
MINVAIVEDSNTIRNGLEMLIEGTKEYKSVAAYEDCESLLENINNLEIDVILMDLNLPGMSGIEGIKKLKEISSDYIILVLTVYDENELIFDALCAGASGYLIKKTPPAKLLEAIKDASEGGAPMSSSIARKVVDFFQNTNRINSPVKSDVQLTPREKEVLSGLVEGYSYKAIADSLFISIDTVKFHFRNIYKKLHVHSQSEAVAKAIKQGLV